MWLFNKKQKFDNIELPPPPPPSSELPPMPPVDNTQSLDEPPLPNLEDDYEAKQPGDLPPLVPPSDLSFDQIPLPDMPVPDNNDETELPLPEMEDAVEEKNVVKQKRAVQGPIYVNIGSYKEAAATLTLIREKIKDSDSYLERLSELKNIKDKYSEQLRSKLEDLQRKCLYVDKIIVGGNLNG
jgi:hypothetical protein